MFATCPDISNLQSLLEDSAGGDESAEIVVHLETCADCQQTLESLAANPCAWEDAARGMVKRSRTESALRGMVERLKNEKPVPPEDDLSLFLSPADKPGLLGMLGPYEVVSQIGRGGMGVVLKAREPALNRVVAIKVLSLHLASSASARRRFVREGRSAAAVCHDHIVTVHGVNEVNGFPYLVMQYIAGESLQERLDRTGPMTVEEILLAGVQIASGLAAAHAGGLIHRDIKPANILLQKDEGRRMKDESRPDAFPDSSFILHPSSFLVKITDFGLARMTDDVNLTQNGVLVGTPEYMAPEQARGEPVDHCADLFSLGSVLYAMCTGRPPFSGEGAMAVLMRVSDQEPVPVRELNPDVPASLEMLIAKLMAKNPAERFQSAAEVAALLEGYLAHLHRPATATAPELPLQPARTPTKRTQRRMPLLAWVGAVAVLAVLALGLGVSLWPLGARVAAPEAEQRPMKEIYQDFRGGKAFRSEFGLSGAVDADKVTKLEPGGLRITLPAARPQHLPIEVCPKFSLFGDFDVTATYELLSAAVPAKGYGVGVALIVADSDKRDKFVKVGRLMRSDKGSVYFSEFWTKKPPEDYQLGSQPTEVRAGQLRIARVGAHLRCLAADEVGKDFTVVFEVPNFGTEEMAQLRFEVTDGCSPNNPVDARLLDLRVRMQAFPPDNGAGPGPLPPQTPIRADNPAPAEAQSARSGWLAAVLVAGFVFTLLLAGAGALLVFLRRRDASAARNQPAAFMSFACPDCGKKLKIEAKLAGKKVKCPACGDALNVPETAPPVPRARRSKFMLWPSVLLGFVLVSLILVGVWFFLPEKSEWLVYPSDRDAVRARGLLDQPLGFDEVGGVEESGFYRMEGGGNTNTLSYRWTNGAAKMVVPIGEVSPKALTAVLGLEASTPFRLAIHVNGFSLFDEKITHRGVWTRSFDLEDAPKRNDMVIDIQSDVFIPSQQTGGKNNDSRQLGVRIYGITLLSGKKEYLNVPLGGAFVPGVEDSGFHKAYKEGDSYVRWTTGAAQLKVPIRQKRPKALAVTMDIPKQLKDRIEIVVNKRKLLDEPVEAKTNWTRRIPLDGVDVQDQLLIELRSSTWVPSQIDAASKVAPVLGVRVKKVLLLEE